MQLDESEPSFGQAGSSAGELLVETETFDDRRVPGGDVFDTGGERYPKINDSLDFLAFCHRPHFAVVEVAPSNSSGLSRAGADATRDRHHPPTPVRVHGARPGRSDANQPP